MMRYTGIIKWTGLMVGTLLAVLLSTQICLGQTNSDRIAALEMRRDSLINFFANRIEPGELSKGGYYDLAAKLYLGKDMNWVLARLDSMIANVRGDMFWMYPMTLINFIGKDRLPDNYKRKLRDQWRTYTPYRGDTENHWAMYYAALYLMNELYPDDPAESWYNGRSSVENREEAREYLYDWMDLTTTIGQGEYDSARYMDFYLIPMAELYAFAQDPEMKQRAGMMLDWLLADFAVDNLDGLYAGASSRLYPLQVLNRWADNITGYSWLLFGNTPFSTRGGGLILALSGYQPPEVLYRIATDRSNSYVQKELKRTRHRIRYSDERNVPIYKYMFMRDAYAVGSTQGGFLQPIQQHTWEVMWANEDPSEGYNVLFSVHPTSSTKELAMYFPEEPKLLTEVVVRSKGTYDSPEKWVSGSEHEQVFQEKDALIALYDIPKGTRYSRVDAFFSRFLEEKDEADSGWIFVRGGNAFIAYRPLAEHSWVEEKDGDWRLHSTVLKNGAVVQVAEESEFDSFEAFKEAIHGLPLDIDMENTPHVRFTSLRGDEMELAFGSTPELNGQPVDYDKWELFDGPFLYAEKGGKQLEMRHGKLRRTIDFNTLSTRDWVE